MTTCLSWGAGTQGQLGNGTWKDALQPTPVLHLPKQGIQQVVCGANHAVCLTEKAVYVWGAIHFGSSSSGKSLHDFEAAQQQHKEAECESSTCAGLQTGIIAASSATSPQTAGSSSTGSGTAAICCEPRLLLLPSPEIAIRRVAAGWQHTLFLADTAQLFVAGDNHFGQLGLGQDVHTTTQLVLLDLRQLPGQHVAVPGQQHAAAQRLPATAEGAAHHSAGSMGAEAQVVDIAAGMWHSLALLQLQTPSQHDAGISASCTTCVVGWGMNKQQQLGPCNELEPMTCSSSLHKALHAVHTMPVALTSAVSKRNVVWPPSLLTGLQDAHVRRLAAGGERSAGITRQGHLLLWGRTLPGGTAAATGNDGAYTCLPAPSRHAAWLPAHSSSPPVGIGADALLRPAAGSPGPAGSTSHRAEQLSSRQPLLGRAETLGAVSVEKEQLIWHCVCLGWRHLVALDSAGQVWSAGDNTLGQLGVETSHRQPQQHVLQATVKGFSKPLLQAAGGLHAVQLPMPAHCVAAGAEHSVALLSDGSTWAWGWAEHGQLGTGNTSDQLLPKKVLQMQRPGDQCDAVVQAGSLRDESAGAATKSDSSDFTPKVLTVQPSGVACGSAFTVIW